MVRAPLHILLTMKYYAISVKDDLSGLKGELHNGKLITGRDLGCTYLQNTSLLTKCRVFM